MADAKKPKIGMIYKIGAFLAFVLLGYLGIRSYKLSVEKLKINGCIDEIGQIFMNAQDVFKNQNNYKTLDYKSAVKFNIIPKKMFREGGRGEAFNSYGGGVDIFATPLLAANDDKAFSVSFQGITSYGCQELVRTSFSDNPDLIAVGAFPKATAADALDEVYSFTLQEDIKQKNIFLGSEAKYVSMDKLEKACACGRALTCTIIWKFK